MRLGCAVAVVWAAPFASLLDRLEGAQGIAGYAWIALGIVVGGVGVPIPEEAVLAAAGWLASAGRISLAGAFAVAWASVVTWDVALHGVGRRLGPGLEASRWGRRVGAERWASARRFFARRGAWAVALARFVMGARIATFLLAGAAGMPRAKFVAVVAPLALVSCGIPLALGYALGDEVEAWLHGFRAAQWVILALLAAVLVLLWLLSRRRARR